MEQQQIIDRRGSGSLKWDTGSTEELALWVADMDFASPRIVIDAIARRLLHPVLGYGKVDPACADNFTDWCSRRQGWTPQKDALILTHSMLGAIGTAIELFSEPGDAIIIQTPVYHPFSTIPGQLGRRLLRNPLTTIDSGNGNPYRIDMNGLRKLVETEKPRMLVLCSPHNPVGRVWTKPELESVLELCVQNKILLISDEIHADLVLPGFPFVSIGALIGEGTRFPASAAIVLQAPSKTFNIPGLPSCFAYIPDRSLCQRFREGISGLGMSTVNILSQVACAAAYGDAEPWLDEVLSQIESNYQILAVQVSQWRTRWPLWSDSETKGLKLISPEGTYLAWLRIASIQETLDKGNQGLQAWFRKEAKVFLSAGIQFGEDGDFYMRINVGTHASVLKEALQRIQTALDTLYATAQTV